MNERPETKYAWNGDVALAYQVFGSGPVDLVYMQGGAGSHVDLNWESPYLGAVPTGAGPARTRDPHGPTRLGVLGPLLARRRGAARGPGRRPRRGDGCGGLRARRHLRLVRDRVTRDVVRGHEPASGRPVWCSAIPSRRTAPPTRRRGRSRRSSGRRSARRSGRAGGRRSGRWTRGSAMSGSVWSGSCRSAERPSRPAPSSPRSERFHRADVRAILPSIHVPTLVVGIRDGEGWTEQLILNPRFVAERIAGARLIEPPAADNAWFHWYARAPVDPPRDRGAARGRPRGAGVVRSGARDGAVHRHRRLDRNGGHDGRREVARPARRTRPDRERHHRPRSGGPYVRGTGDGFLATFDGPARGVRCAAGARRRR